MLCVTRVWLEWLRVSTAWGYSERSGAPAVWIASRMPSMGPWRPWVGGVLPPLTLSLGPFRRLLFFWLICRSHKMICPFRKAFPPTRLCSLPSSHLLQPCMHVKEQRKGEGRRPYSPSQPLAITGLSGWKAGAPILGREPHPCPVQGASWHRGHGSLSPQGACCLVSKSFGKIWSSHQSLKGARGGVAESGGKMKKGLDCGATKKHEKEWPQPPPPQKTGPRDPRQGASPCSQLPYCSDPPSSPGSELGQTKSKLWGQHGLGGGGGSQDLKAKGLSW